MQIVLEGVRLGDLGEPQPRTGGEPELKDARGEPEEPALRGHMVQALQRDQRPLGGRPGQTGGLGDGGERQLRGAPLKAVRTASPRASDSTNSGPSSCLDARVHDAGRGRSGRDVGGRHLCHAGRGVAQPGQDSLPQRLGAVPAGV